jgi:hypothetical protein
VRDGGKQSAVFTGNNGVQVEVAECVGRGRVLVAVPMEPLMPLAFLVRVEEEEIVVAALDVEGEDDEEGIGEALGGGDVYTQVRAIDAGWRRVILTALDWRA